MGLVVRNQEQWQEWLQKDSWESDSPIPAAGEHSETYWAQLLRDKRTQEKWRF